MARQRNTKPKAKKNLTSSDFKEFHYIVDINNVPNILQHGILSHNKVRSLGLYKKNNDISDEGVQGCRKKHLTSPRTKTKKPLHDYANLYLQANNAMLLVIQKKIPATKLCVLRINAPLLLEHRGHEAIFTSRNAASHQAVFSAPNKWMTSPDTTKALTSLRLSGLEDTTFVGKWGFFNQKQKRQSEVLFKDRIDPEYINGVYVYDESAQHQVTKITSAAKRPGIKVDIHATMFPEPKKGAFSRSMKPFSAIQNAIAMEYNDPSLDTDSDQENKRRRKTNKDDIYYYPNSLTSC